MLLIKDNNLTNKSEQRNIVKNLFSILLKNIFYIDRR